MVMSNRTPWMMTSSLKTWSNQGGLQTHPVPLGRLLSFSVRQRIVLVGRRSAATGR